MPAASIVIANSQVGDFFPPLAPLSRRRRRIRPRPSRDPPLMAGADAHAAARSRPLACRRPTASSSSPTVAGSASAAAARTMAAFFLSSATSPTSRSASERSREAQRAGRGGEPRQVQLPRQYEPRAAHAARTPSSASPRSWPARCSARSATGNMSTIPPTSCKAAAICSTSSTACSTSPRARPASSSSIPSPSICGEILDDCAAMMREQCARAGLTLDFARRRDAGPGAGRAGEAAPDLAQPAVERGEIHRARRHASRVARARRRRSDRGRRVADTGIGMSHGRYPDRAGAVRPGR